MNNNNNSSGGFSFSGMLAILFIGLKLLDVTVVATWSWWWVLSPLWLPAAIVIVIALAVGIWSIFN